MEVTFCMNPVLLDLRLGRMEWLELELVNVTKVAFLSKRASVCSSSSEDVHLMV